MIRAGIPFMRAAPSGPITPSKAFLWELGFHCRNLRRTITSMNQLTTLIITAVDRLALDEISSIALSTPWEACETTFVSAEKFRFRVCAPYQKVAK